MITVGVTSEHRVCIYGYTGPGIVIRVPSPYRLALKEQFDRTVASDETVTPRIRPSSDGRIRPYDGREAGHG